MFLVWGKKKVERKIGYVAENCPRCLEVRVVRIKRVGMADHLFFLPIGKGYLLGFVGECERCAGKFDIQPTDYLAFERNAKMELQLLIAKTNPKLLPENSHDREQFDRFKIVRDPFLRFNQSYEDRYSVGTRFDYISSLALFATFVIPILVAYAGFHLPIYESLQGIIGKIAWLVFATGVLLTCKLIVSEKGRFFKKNLFPELVRCLKPLNPQISELDYCINLLRRNGYRISKYLTAQDINSAIKSS